HDRPSLLGCPLRRWFLPRVLLATPQHEAEAQQREAQRRAGRRIRARACTAGLIARVVAPATRQAAARVRATALIITDRVVAAGRLTDAVDTKATRIAAATISAHAADLPNRAIAIAIAARGRGRITVAVARGG